MNQDKVKFTKLAAVAYDSLPERLQEETQRLLSEAGRNTSAPSLKGKFFRIPRSNAAENYYFLKIGSKYRAIVRLIENQLLVSDIVEHAPMKALFANAH